MIRSQRKNVARPGLEQATPWCAVRFAPYCTRRHGWVLEERMLNVFSRKVSYSDKQNEDRGSRDVLERYIPIKQEMIFRKEIDKVTEETVPTRTENDPVPDQNEKILVLLKQIVDRDKEFEKKKCYLHGQLKLDRQSLIHCAYFQIFSPFSGDDPKPKSEASFEEWKYEVQCIMKEISYSNSAITQAVRKSLRCQAKSYTPFC